MELINYLEKAIKLMKKNSKNGYKQMRNLSYFKK